MVLFELPERKRWARFSWYFYYTQIVHDDRIYDRKLFDFLAHVSITRINFVVNNSRKSLLEINKISSSSSSSKIAKWKTIKVSSDYFFGSSRHFCLLALLNHAAFLNGNLTHRVRFALRSCGKNILRQTYLFHQVLAREES